MCVQFMILKLKHWQKKTKCSKYQVYCIYLDNWKTKSSDQVKNNVLNEAAADDLSGGELGEGITENEVFASCTLQISARKPLKPL